MTPLLQVALDSNGYLKIIPASKARPPFTYINSLKLDAQGRLVIAG